MTTGRTAIIVFNNGGGCSRRRIGGAFFGKSCLTRIFFCLKAGCFCRLFFSATIIFGATTFVIAVGLAGLFVATTRFFQPEKTGFFGLSQQLGLQVLPRQSGLCRTRRWGRCLCDFRRRRGCRGGRRCRCRSGCSLGLRRIPFARLHHPTALDLDHHGVRAPMAETLFDLACFHSPLDAKRRAHAQLWFVV